MGSRVVDRLRSNGVHVSEENENLVKAHFDCLPKRYGIAVRANTSEVLMHISLLEDARRDRRGGGQIVHCLRAVVANLPRKDPGKDVTNWSPTGSNGEGQVTPPASPSNESCLPIYQADDKPINSHRIVSATPDKKSYLDHGSLSSGGSYGDLASAASYGSGTNICLQDCYELTVAMECDPGHLGTVYTTLAATGLTVAETHGFTTNDGYYLYWFVLQDMGRAPTSEHMTALDNLLHARFSLDAKISQAQNPPPGGRGGRLFNRRGSKDSQSTESNENSNSDRPRGMKRESSFLNLWKGDLGVQPKAVAEWEVDPDHLLLSKKVGQGAFGAIHKGTFRGEEVAIKYIKSDFNKEFEYIKEFAQEISIISELAHENIVKFIGACTKGERVCIIYEYMANGNLKDYLQKSGKGSKLSDVERLKYALEVCRGMVYLSKKNIVHRDLKAANILISESGTVKIGDFGVARLLPRNEDCMTAETGTYRWMAPEVIEHKPYNSKADVYSFGVLLWELMTGGKSPYELLSPIQAAIGVAKHGVRPKIPHSCCPRVAEVMSACWAPEAEDRPTFEAVERMLIKAIEECDKMEKEKDVKASVLGGNTKQNSFTGLLSRILK